MIARRHVLGTAFSGAAALASLGSASDAWALPAATLQFPRDHGAHLDFRTEWWYITGYANTAGREAAYGFQVTFFRSRVGSTQTMRSRLAARHLLFAHAAITDVAGNKLWHDQRMARWSGEAASRNAADLASANTQSMDVVLRDWSLREEADATAPSGSRLRAHIIAESFALQLQFLSTQPLLLQGDGGLSRKGPQPEQASYYYSRPQLAARGSLSIGGRNMALTDGSSAWLDHEWSQALLHPDAVGWDWIGINLLDGSALTAFQVRTRSGETLWDGGSYRPRGGSPLVFRAGNVLFLPLRTWLSPRNGARYPVEWQVRTLSGAYTVKAVVDDQELDSRASTGAVYWEGLCTVHDSNDRLVGRGYLEMTGYAQALSLG